MIVAIPITLVSAFLLSYEFYAVATGRKPITTYIRDAFRAYPATGFLVGLVAGLLLAHFFWFQ